VFEPEFEGARERLTLSLRTMAMRDLTPACDAEVKVCSGHGILTSFPKEGARLVAAPGHRLLRQSLRRPVSLLLEIIARAKPRGVQPAIGGPVAGLVIGVLRHGVVGAPGGAPRRIALEVIKNLLQDGLVALSDPLGLGE